MKEPPVDGDARVDRGHLKTALEDPMAILKAAVLDEARIDAGGIG